MDLELIKWAYVAGQKYTQEVIKANNLKDKADGLKCALENILDCLESNDSGFGYVKDKQYEQLSIAMKKAEALL